MERRVRRAMRCLRSCAVGASVLCVRVTRGRSFDGEGEGEGEGERDGDGDEDVEEGAASPDGVVGVVARDEGVGEGVGEGVSRDLLGGARGESGGVNIAVSRCAASFLLERGLF